MRLVSPPPSIPVFLMLTLNENNRRIDYQNRIKLISVYRYRIPLDIVRYPALVRMCLSKRRLIDD